MSILYKQKNGFQSLLLLNIMRGGRFARPLRQSLPAPLFISSLLPDQKEGQGKEAGGKSALD